MPESVSRVQEFETEELRRRVTELEARLFERDGGARQVRRGYEQLKKQS
ncbi:MAG TPA: hypothetical protein VK550_00185 [Polyangiaceae bacterium]|nr:hypothetical protein [Polyangiaceae bacterium]